MSLLTELDSTVLASQTLVAIQGGTTIITGGSATVTTAPYLTVTGSITGLQMLNIAGNAVITGGIVGYDKLDISGRGIVSGAISGYSTLNVTGIIRSESQLDAPFVKSTSALIVNGLAVSDGYLGFLNVSNKPLKGPLVVTNDAAYAVSGLLTALSNYGLITIG